MTTVAFIGLGIMGGPMAANLISAGFEVVGYNRSPGAIGRLTEIGGHGAASVAEAVAEADLIATMLPDTPDVVAVLTGENGVFDHARPGALIVDFSTIQPEVSAEIAEKGIAAGFRVLDAPVSGGQQGATDGILSVMVGGADSSFAAAKDVLDAVGKTIVHVGPAGAGQTVKAANQLIVAGTLELLAEAIVFLEAYSVDTEAAIKVLAGGLAGSAVIDRKAASMIAREFTPGFRVNLHHKDMGIVTAAARKAGVAIPLGALTAQLLGALNARGGGDLDHTALVTIVEELSGRTR